jgi:hypothetical protein
LFNWLDKHDGNPQRSFDIALLLRACNLFSRFSIEAISPCEVDALGREAKLPGPIDGAMLRPAELIESNRLSQIQHGIKRFAFKNGALFAQFSTSDFFKAIHVVMGGRLSADNNALYAPLRLFDDETLVLPSGRSLIARLMAMASHLVVEDVDLSRYHIERHIERFALKDDLCVADVTARTKKRSAMVYVITKGSAER